MIDSSYVDATQVLYFLPGLTCTDENFSQKVRCILMNFD